MKSRKIAVIMFTDMVGYSMKVHSNEDHALTLLKEHNEIIELKIALNGGNIVKRIGDAFMVEFQSAFNAINAAVQIQGELMLHNANKEDRDKIEIRVGIHVGDVVIQDNDMFGDGVNIASRIESEAEGGQILVSQEVYSMTRSNTEHLFKYTGVHALKNIERPMDVYEVLWDPKRKDEASEAPRLTPKARKRTFQTIAATIILTAGLIFFLSFEDPSGHSGNITTKPPLAIVGISNETGHTSVREMRIHSILTNALVHKFYEFPVTRLVSPILVSRANRTFSDEDLGGMNDPDKVERVAQMVNSRLVISGSLTAVGDTYWLAAKLDDIQEQRLISSVNVMTISKRDLVGTIIDSIATKFQHSLIKTFPMKDLRWVAPYSNSLTDSLEAYSNFVQGWEKFQIGELETAIALYNKAIQIDTNFALAYSEVARTYYFARKKDEMPVRYIEKLYEFRNQFDGISVTDLIFKGNLAWIDDKPEMAARNYELIIKLYPDERAGYFLHGLYLHYMVKDLSGALVRYEDARRLTPEFFPITREMAFIFHETKGTEKAVELVRDFMIDFPDNPALENARKLLLWFATTERV